NGGLTGGEDLTRKLGISSATFWPSQERALDALREQIDRLGSQFVALEEEGKRQFNIGLTNTVTANVEFPRLFRPYVALANDTLLALDINLEERSQFADKEKVNRAIDLLVELKGIVIQTVRSLSKHGTIAMRTRNRLCAGVEADALLILKAIADAKVTDDIDERNPYAVLADLLGKERDTEVAPYVVLARDGGRLLLLTLELYDAEKESLED